MKRKILLALIGTVLILCSSVALAHQVKRIVWNPTDLRTVVKSGESYTQTITLHQNRKAPVGWSHQLQVLVKGEIAEYVTVTQPTFPKPFRKGEQVTVEVTITAPEETPLTILEGEIVVKRVRKNGKQFPVWRAAKLPVTITFSDIDLPPFPDPDIDEETILGTDADKDGVPDRVEYWAVGAFPESEVKRAALSLQAEQQQAFLVDYLAHRVNGPEDPYDDVVRERVLNAHNPILQASDCLQYIFNAVRSVPGEPQWDAYDDAGSELFVAFYNTGLRLHALREAERPLVGTGSESVPDDQYEQQCIGLGLNPDSFSN